MHALTASSPPPNTLDSNSGDEKQPSCGAWLSNIGDAADWALLYWNCQLWPLPACQFMLHDVGRRECIRRHSAVNFKRFYTHLKCCTWSRAGSSTGQIQPRTGQKRQELGTNSRCTTAQSGIQRRGYAHLWGMTFYIATFALSNITNDSK